VDDFFRSVSGAFLRNRGEWPGAVATALLLAALVVVLVALQSLRARRMRRSRLAALAARHGLEGQDLDLAHRLAALSGRQPADVLAHLDVFERSTARALAVRSPPAAGAGGGGAAGEADAADRIRRLRHLLGFDRLPPHAPLLSSRELAPGTAIHVEESAGQVSSVDEHAFTVEVAAPAPAATGGTVTLALVHAREARYRLRCPVLKIRSPAGGAPVAAMVLGHDEAPERLQSREYARAAVKVDVALRPLVPWPTHPPLRRVTATTVDLSAGGALVASRTPLPVGVLLAASFAVGGERFEAVRTVVLATDPDPEGSRTHLEFGPMTEAERDRLVAAVERAERGAAVPVR